MSAVHRARRRAAREYRTRRRLQDSVSEVRLFAATLDTTIVGNRSEMSSNDLLVDLRSAAKKPSPNEVTAWASDQRAFISSVMADLKAERAAVAESIRTVGVEPVWFEQFGGRDSDPQDAYLGEVASSSIYIGLLGREYGRLLKSRLSATHAEYRKAEVSGLRICVWTKAGSDQTADEHRFLEEIQTFHVTNSYQSVKQLADSVRERLIRLAAEDLSPWCKLGHVVFRASVVHDSSDEVTILASVHDPSVVAALEAMRPTFWSDDVRKASYAGRSRNLQLKRVETRVITSRSTQVELRFVSASAPDDRPLSFSFTGAEYSTDDVVAINLRKALFGSPGPGGLAILGGTINDPLDPIRKLRPPEEVVRPLVHLLITEALVGTGQAANVTRVRLSQPFEGERQILVEWQPRGANSPVRSVEGKVRL